MGHLSSAWARKYLCYDVADGDLEKETINPFRSRACFIYFMADSNAIFAVDAVVVVVVVIIVPPCGCCGSLKARFERKRDSGSVETYCDRMRSKQTFCSSRGHRGERYQQQQQQQLV